MTFLTSYHYDQLFYTCFAEHHYLSLYSIEYGPPHTGATWCIQYFIVIVHIMEAC